MVYNILLYGALIVFFLGLALKVSRWFFHSSSPRYADIPARQRVRDVLRGVISTLFSGRLLALIQTLLLDVLGQRPLWHRDRLTWCMHVLIFYGFLGLLLMHALHTYVVDPFLTSSYYAPTLNPYLFLRNFFGLLLLAGIVIALYRRFVLKVPRLRQGAPDHLALILLGLLIFSGLFLEMVRIPSPKLYRSMVADYTGDTLDPLESQALESYWVKIHGLAPFSATITLDKKQLELGKELNELFCAECHSDSRWGFLGYTGSRLVKPVAPFLDRIALAEVLWYLHWLVAFIGLAYLPFSKFFHALTSPLSLLVNTAHTNSHNHHPGSLVVKQIMELDACTRCGECSRWCSACVNLEEVPFPDMLPALRVSSMQVLTRARPLGGEAGQLLWEGSYRCTMCGRCKEVCPVGIGLRDLWLSMRESLVARKLYPPKMNMLRDGVRDEHNIANFPNEDRALWVEMMPDPPDDLYQRTTAELVYFVGCVGSLSPAAQKIPEAFVKLLDTATVDFTLLGEQEWCCGFPLLIAGMYGELEELRAHNLEKIKAIGAHSVVFTCPSCYSNWLHHYQEHAPHLRPFHASQLLRDLIKEGRLQPGPLSGRVTYHDPCDLGRGSAEYRAPREVLHTIPDLEFVEMNEYGRMALCCGGGGDVEVADAEVTTRISQARTRQIEALKVDAVVTGCQQCVRTLQLGMKEIGSPTRVMDISELLWRALQGHKL
jgi:Fe-S oxidoreductase/nitrate reductase gamma subunit